MTSLKLVGAIKKQPTAHCIRMTFIVNRAAKKKKKKKGFGKLEMVKVS